MLPKFQRLGHSGAVVADGDDRGRAPEFWEHCGSAKHRQPGDARAGLSQIVVNESEQVCTGEPEDIDYYFAVAASSVTEDLHV